MQPTRQNRLSHRRCREGEREGEGRDGNKGRGGRDGGRFVARGWKGEGRRLRKGGMGKEEMGGEVQVRGVL